MWPVLALVASVAASDPPALHLESWRLRSRAVFVGTVTGVRRLGALDGLTADMQGRMEATVKIDKVLARTRGRARSRRSRGEVRQPRSGAGGDGFFALAAGERVLVFADGFEPAYPRELFHGAPRDVAVAIKALRDFVNTMDAPTLRAARPDARDARFAGPAVRRGAGPARESRSRPLGNAL